MLDALLREYVISVRPWPRTDEEIDALLSEDPEVDAESLEARAARVKAVLTACGEKPTPANGEQLVLFETDCGVRESTDVRPRDLFEIVRRAYREVHDGWSSDRLIADPDMDARFIHACWRLGAQASQFDLNLLLINARKRKIIGKTDGGRKYHVDPVVMDQYWLASEFAARIIQDREFLNRQNRITVDHILCDPRLARDFDELARVIAPGYSSLDYRWAALAIRKARSRSEGNAISEGSFEWLGRLDGIRPRQIPPVEGFLWVRMGKASLYICHGQNVRTQTERVLQAGIERIMSEFPLFDDVERDVVELGIAERPKWSAWSRQPKNLVDGFKPCLNLLSGRPAKRHGKDFGKGETGRACGAA